MPFDVLFNYTVEPTPSETDVTIVTRRSHLAVAPESIEFEADLSGASFDTPAPGSSVDYDEQYHGLLFVWDFGDAGTWSAPTNILTNWSNRNLAYGKRVGHMFSDPGTYNVSVNVFEFSTGKSASHTVTVTVQDPNTFYTGANTICLNPAGDNDFSDKPAGALEFQSDDLFDSGAAWAAVRAVGGPARLLLKRGASYNLFLSTSAADAHDIYIGDYGSGTAPVLNLPATSSFPANVGFNFSNQYATAAKLDVRLVNLVVAGGYDPSDKTGDVQVGIWLLSQVNLLANGCIWTNIGGSSILSPSQQNWGYNVHLNDCTVTAFGGQYATYYSENLVAGSSVIYTGCAIVQSPNAVSDPDFRAPCRIQSISFVHMRGCDFFHMDDSQPCLKCQETPKEDGLRANIHSCSFEGGLSVVAFGRNFSETFAGGTSAKSARVNILFDGNIIIGNQRTQFMTECWVGGVTIRNNLAIQPDIPHRLNYLQYFTMFEEFTLYSAHSTDMPQKVYSNHFVNLRSHANNGNYVPSNLSNGATWGSYSNVEQNNNLVHMPEMNSTAYEPLDISTLHFVPRNPGYRSNVSPFTLDTNFATPGDTVKSFEPLSGSPAIGSAGGGICGDLDVTGLRRDQIIDPLARNAKSIGAYESALET